MRELFFAQDWRVRLINPTIRELWEILGNLHGNSLHTEGFENLRAREKRKLLRQEMVLLGQFSPYTRVREITG